MEPENQEEGVIVEEEVVEETAEEETPVEEGPTPESEPDIVHLPFTISNTRENLVIIAIDRGFPTMVEKPDNTPETPLQDRYMPNPADPIVWLNDHIKDFLAGIASKPFIEAQRRLKQQEIEAEAERVRTIARQSIN